MPHCTTSSLADDILFNWGDMHSHYDIKERDGGFAVIRTFEIDDGMLEEYRVPTEQTILWKKTIDELYDAIIAVEKVGKR